MFAARQCVLVCVVASLATTGFAQEIAKPGDEEKAKPPSLAEEMPRIAATEPQDALKTFEVQQGFRLELVASEPMVSDPVDACFDENGRMFVAEMHGYPYSQEPTRLNPKGGGKPDAGIVRLLEDTDGDGRMDRSVVFADKLRWPTSVCCYDGGVFVLAPPTLWWFKDTTGDGKADIRHRVFDGFNRDNVQAVANNMKWGLDHRIYVAGGRNPSVITKDGKELLKLGNIDFSFDPLSETVRPETGGVQFGHSFDDWGNRFVCSNSNHIQHVVVPYEYTSRETWSGPPAIKSIAVEGAAAPVFRRSQAEPWRIVRTRRRVADPKFAGLPPTEKVAIGFFTSATSVTIYRGDAWPEEYRGQAFIGDVGGNLVHRKILEPDGVSFKARRADQNHEFLASTDNWFRPTNFVNAPDGTLYLLDMYRETIEHPYSIPEDIKEHLDLESGSDRGRIYRLVAKNGVRKPVEKLGGHSAKELAKRLASKNAWARETAYRLLWERHDKDNVAEEIHALWESKQAVARVLALHCAATLNRRGLVLHDYLLKAGIEDPHPEVRRIAYQLGQGRTNQIKDPPPETNSRVLFAKAAYPPTGSSGVPLGFEQILFHEDAYVSAVAANSNLAFLLVRGLTNGRHRLNADSHRVLLRAAKTPWFDSVINEICRRSVRDVQGALDHLELNNELRLRIARVARQHVDADYRGGLIVGPVLDKAIDTVKSANSSEKEQILAIGLLAHGGSEHRKFLQDLVEPGQSSAVQSEAVRGVIGFLVEEGDQSWDRKWNSLTLDPLLDKWSTIGPTVRKTIVEELVRSIPRTKVLLKEIKSGRVPARDIDPATRKFLTGHASSEIASAAKELLKPEPTASRKEVLAKYQPALDVAGEVAKGRELFLKKCSICHKVGDQGHLVAPEIVSVVNKSPNDLLIAILDPNREAQPNFTQYTVITKAGKVFTGMIAEETGASLTLRRAEGKQDVIRRADIAELVSSGKSLMPEGFEKDLSPEQIRDIIAFVKSLGVKKPE